jgi:hypothetical protein
MKNLLNDIVKKMSNNLVENGSVTGTLLTDQFVKSSMTMMNGPGVSYLIS